LIKIICQGGLGNQLFIWAAAHFLAEKYEELIQITYLARDSASINIELAPLLPLCKHQISVKNDPRLSYFINFVDILSYRLPVSRACLRRMFGITDYVNPHENIEIGKYKPRIIRGYFNNNELVESVLPLIEEELKAYICKLNNGEEVKKFGAIHIRRGDYLLAPEIHGILSFSYYMLAMNPKLKYIIFTEDSKDCENLIRSSPQILTIIDGKTHTAWKTLALMTTAKEIITANSTLSWWAGRLAANNGTKVYIPFPWNRNGYSNQQALISKSFSTLKPIYDEVQN
jgi:hypothetical protein